MKNLSAMLAFMCGTLMATAGPVTLSFVPSNPVLTALGQSVAIDVVVSGVMRPPSVGAFDLDVTYDASMLSPGDVVFGPFLGDASLSETLTDITFSPGLVDFAAVSLLPSTDLDALQPDSFRLATLQFTATGYGASLLTFTQTIVDDAFGAKIENTTNIGRITSIPEPSGWVLLAIGLAAIAYKRCQVH